MKKSLVFHVCGLLCSILLVSPKASCFSLQMLKKRDIQDGNGELVGMGVPESLPGGSLLPTPSTILKDVNVSVILPNVVPIVPEEIQNSSGLLNTSNVNTYPEANNVSVANEAGPSSENGLLTTLGSSTDYPTGVTSLGIPSQGDPKGPSQLPDEKSVNLDQSSLDNSSQVNTIEMLTTNPRTSIFKTEDNQPTTSSPLIGQMITFVNAITSESPTGLGTSTLDNQNNDSLSSTMSQINEEWDDTKGTTQRSDTASSDGITPSPDQVLENESSKTAVFTIHSGVTVPSDDKSVFSTDEKTTEEKLMETDVSPGPDTEDFPTPLPSTAIDGAQAQDFPVYTADVKQPNMDISENTNVTVAPAITMDVSSQETIREPGMIDKAEETAKESTAPQVVIPRNESATASPTTTQALPIEMPSTQSTLNGSLAKDEDDLAGSVSSVVLKAPAETESSTVTAATSVPQASMMAPPARRITATPAFGSDRLESDEGDEEEDEDDEDDEADEDEEDEEDEKDNDSVDDSAERDSDLPLFTLPGLSSQEPLEDDSNVALIEGAAYQVPDTMEWEQQNQGLVRSWMEKLKDKAGYMSGMLVPVGVGIAGALLILGALYSIKIMNRRRRNGFKRHKRKQREFNSMQDRVMLLADSSEDEF
ncbi:armadillo-like helical domain-containing protein 4 isoform X1 [Rana temporaria]|uniref:armadillo-like helical domain-containing protein 4 isoform X1 n=1 Tax=Rana temporaria TaxID=8407 RepID=UPI001AAD4DDC|nr:armadillo-like helical domain-containing protein 4 isoform X1 [Rana temporaria]